jgi:hypothetical protein
MSKQAIKLLKSRDPAQRKRAIKAVARDKDRDAVKQLLKMASDDPEKELQKLAGQAAIYIRKKWGELPSQKDDNRGRDQKPAKVMVTDKDAAKALQALKDAQTFLDKDERAKASKLLLRAMKLDPNTRQDSYLISLAEVLTGAEGDEAVELLGDQSLFRSISDQKEGAQRQQDDADHLEKIAKTGGKEVILDISLLIASALIGTLLAFFLVSYSAQAYQDKYDQNHEDFIAAEARGWCKDKDGEYVCYRDNPAKDSQKSPIPTFKWMTMTDEFRATVDDWKDAEASRILMPGVIIGIGSGIAAILVSIIIHLISGLIFRGQGRLAHTIHGVSVAILSRGVLLLLVAIVGIIAIFNQGGNETMLLAFEGIAGLVVVLLVLAVIMAVSRAYKQNFALALVSSAIGLAPVVAAVVFGLMQMDILKL